MYEKKCSQTYNKMLYSILTFIDMTKELKHKSLKY